MTLLGLTSYVDREGHLGRTILTHFGEAVGEEGDEHARPTAHDAWATQWRRHTAFGVRVPSHTR